MVDQCRNIIAFELPEVKEFSSCTKASAVGARCGRCQAPIAREGDQCSTALRAVTRSRCESEALFHHCLCCKPLRPMGQAHWGVPTIGARHLSDSSQAGPSILDLIGELSGDSRTPKRRPVGQARAGRMHEKQSMRIHRNGESAIFAGWLELRSSGIGQPRMQSVVGPVPAFA